MKPKNTSSKSRRLLTRRLVMMLLKRNELNELKTRRLARTLLKRNELNELKRPVLDKLKLKRPVLDELKRPVLDKLMLKRPALNELKRPMLDKLMLKLLVLNELKWPVPDKLMLKLPKLPKAQSLSPVEEMKLTIRTEGEQSLRMNFCEEWRLWREFRHNVSSLFSRHTPADTVGAVALDAFGSLACGTSTGGIVGKRPGRVGDSPLPGCGGYANAYGAASATGHGEAIMKVTLSRLALSRLQAIAEEPPREVPKPSCQRAAEEALQDLEDTGPAGRGGLLLLSRQGELSAVSLSTRGAGGSTHAGVAEFTAEDSGEEGSPRPHLCTAARPALRPQEGTVGVPPRVALCLTKGSGLDTLDAVGQVEIRYVKLPRCRKSRVVFQPRGEGFHAGGMKVVSLDLEHVLLETLRGHTALTQDGQAEADAFPGMEHVLQVTAVTFGYGNGEDSFTHVTSKCPKSLPDLHLACASLAAPCSRGHRTPANFHEKLLKDLLVKRMEQVLQEHHWDWDLACP
eukprot:g7954.t1